MKEENELEIASKYIGRSSLFFIVGYPLTFIIGIIIARKVGATKYWFSFIISIVYANTFFYIIIWN